MALWKIETDLNKNSVKKSNVLGSKKSRKSSASQNSTSWSKWSKRVVPTRSFPTNLSSFYPPDPYIRSSTSSRNQSMQSSANSTNFNSRSRYANSRNIYCHAPRYRYNPANFFLPFGTSRLRDQSYLENHPMSFDFVETPNFENADMSNNNILNQIYSPNEPNDFNDRDRDEYNEETSNDIINWNSNEIFDEEVNDDEYVNENRNLIDVISEEESDDGSSTDDDEENEEHVSLKRRRLNSIGKCKSSNNIKYMKSIASIKCQNSKRIRALAYNSKRNQLAAISMNSTFHLFDVTKFEQIARNFTSFL